MSHPPAPPADPREPEGGDAAGATPARALVVDDDRMVRGYVARLLGAAGYQVEVAATGEEALRSLDGPPFDVVLTDVEMPGLSGLDLLDRFGALPDPPEVIVMTGHSLTSYAVRALRGRAFDFLCKPFDNDHVLLASADRARRHRGVKLENRRLQESLARAHAELALRNERLQGRLADRTRKLVEAMQRVAEISLATVTALADAIEARDPYTGGHCHRVMFWSDLVADELGLRSDREVLRYGAVLHDVGKIGIPDPILLKPGRLDPAEMEVMRSHVLVGERIVRGIPGLEPSLPIVRGHHEMVGGGGYPDGLQGEAIPLHARIVCVVDAFDAMTTTRPYRTALPVEEAVRRLEEARGWQFDSGVLDAFVGRELYRVRPPAAARVVVDADHGTARWAS